MANETGPGNIVFPARGSRALEDRLLANVIQLTEGIPTSPELLTSPVLIVVPSAGLRRHLQVALAQRCGAILGVTLQTAAHVAADVVSRARLTVASGEAMFEVMARRAAAAEASLEEALSPLEDGYGVAAASIRDLLSAGLDQDTMDTAREAVSALPHPPTRKRATALLRAAVATQNALSDAGYGRRADVLRQAAAVVANDPTDAPPARAILIYGFADAPGATLRFLDALIRHAGAQLYVDRPSDPGSSDQEDRGVRFLDRFLGRLGQASCTTETEDSPALRKSFTAAGADAEAREVARRVRILVDNGTTPESIAVVTRDLSSRISPLRRHLLGLGIPFSGGELPAGFHPAGRRIAAVLELLERGPDTSVDRWLEARTGHRRESDLRLALRTIGVTRLQGIAETRVGEWIPDTRRSLSLPVRQGFVAAADDEGGDIRAARRGYARARLEAAVNDARRLRDHLEAWPDRSPLQKHIAHLRALEPHLQLQPRQDRPSSPDRLVAHCWEKALRLLETLERTGVAVTRNEFLLLLRRALPSQLGQLGGNGGGVQVIDVAHARGRTFEHLFLMGLNRDAFPRVVSEDPLLPDRCRTLLATALPDLATAAEGHDEERYLFAQLAGSGETVTLSWLRTDDEGKELAPSTFVLRLLQAGADEPVELPRTLVPTDQVTGRDVALGVALSGSRADLHIALPLAIEDARRHFPAREGNGIEDPGAAAIANARMAVLEEFDPDTQTPGGRAKLSRMGPWLGLIGAASSPLDPRRAPLFVTTLEALARCPWQTFLRRFLRLERNPDPLGGPPGIDRLLVGNTVHRALEELIRNATDSWPKTLADAVTGEPVTVMRPSNADVDRALTTSAEEVARESGILLPGLCAALVHRCRPYVHAALDADWSDGSVSVLGPELYGSVTLGEDTPTQIRFRVDRVDHTPNGVRLTDYKAGAPFSGRTPVGRRNALASQVARGERLQVPAYARVSEDASGRYLFLEPGADHDARSEEIAACDDLVTETLPAVVHTLLDGLSHGVLFPRLLTPQGQEGRACRFCEVKDACLHEDSGTRARLRRASDAARERLRAGESVDAQDSLLSRLFDLGENPS